MGNDEDKVIKISDEHEESSESESEDEDGSNTESDISEKKDDNVDDKYTAKESNNEKQKHPNVEPDPTSQQRASKASNGKVEAERKRKRSNSTIPSRSDINDQPSSDEEMDENKATRLAPSNRYAPTKMMLEKRYLISIDINYMLMRILNKNIVDMEVTMKENVRQ